MYETSILLAGYRILIRSEHSFVSSLCRLYRLDAPLTPETADLVVSATPEEIVAERATSALFAQDSLLTDGYIESICIYRNICRALPPLGGMLLHAAVISDGDRGYAFTADSGTGKTTHVRLWKEAFGEDVRIINGDKPIIRLENGTWYAYGTPWCGKEGWNVNTRVPLSAICFLRRGITNTIAPLASAEALSAVIPQLLMPEEPSALLATLDMLDHLLTHVPLYELHCTISPEAARVARAGMNGEAP